MANDLDDLEIRSEEDRRLETQRLDGFTVSPRSHALRTTLVAVASVAALAAVTLLIVKYQPWKSSPPLRPPAPPSAPAPARAQPAPHVSLPLLDESDDYVRGIADSLSAHPEFTRWLAQTALVRTATVVVSNIADGETPRPHLAFLAPRQRFRATGSTGRRLVADPASFEGYDRVADAVASIDVAAAVAAFHATEPLFDAAYRDLGHPEGFQTALDRAILALLTVPVPAPDAVLVPRPAGFGWADPRLEGLTDAQKQFLRMGPRNVRLIQDKLRELRQRLAVTPRETERPRPGPERRAPEREPLPVPPGGQPV